MRRYYIVSGILLILSTIDFALAAPVLVQGKRQEYVDLVHIPITVSGKRWDEGLGRLEEEFLKMGGRHDDSTYSTFSSNVVQPPAPNPVSSIANPDPLMEPSSCWGNCISWANVWTALKNADPLFLLASSGHKPDHEWTVPHAPQPNPTSSIKIDPSADPNFDWNYWMNVEDPPLASPRPLAASPRPLAASPKGFGQADWYKVDPKNPPSTSGYAPSPTGPEPEVVTPSSPKLESLKEPEGEVVPGPPSSPVDSQPVDLQAAVYAAKGKAKESRRISGTARDVMNAELQPEATTERSLDSESGDLIDYPYWQNRYRLVSRGHADLKDGEPREPRLDEDYIRDAH